MTLVESLLKSHIVSVRTNVQGWHTTNCPMCTLNGQSRPDTRRRGGFKFNGDRVGYHCFNCGYTTGWSPGRRLGFKLIKLLRALSVDEGEIQRLKIQLWDQVDESDSAVEEERVNIDWPSIEFPWLVTDQLSNDAAEYLRHRRLLGQAPFVQTASKILSMEQRVILPYIHENRIVGYQARLIRETQDKKTPKILASRPPNYVFNLAAQNKKRKYTVVVEGEYDALSIAGVAVMTNSISAEQAKIIEDLDTEPVILADRDTSGRQLIEQAALLGWSASFPDWPSNIKDANDAVIAFGKAAALQSILTSVESNALKIKLLARQWCS